MLECVVNVSEGRARDVITAIAGAGGDAVLDVHSDPDHHRSVLTMAGSDLEAAVRAVAVAVVEAIDIHSHRGVHPRLGALDVVPFAPLSIAGDTIAQSADLDPAVEARDRFAAWAGAELALPCFVYGPERSLPEVRLNAFAGLDPDTGPRHPHPSAGACAVGARPALIAYNVWLDTADEDVARDVATALRSPVVRTLGVPAGGVTQVSCNLIDPMRFGPADAYDAVTALAGQAGVGVVRAELVGLISEAAVRVVPEDRWAQLDIGLDRTIEARLAERGGR